MSGLEDAGAEGGPEEAGADAASERLRRVLMVTLGGLAIVGCAVIAAELALHLAAVAEAWRELDAVRRAASPKPLFQADASVNGALVLEAVLLEPLFIASLVGVVSLHRRASFALAVAGLIAFNLAALGFGLSGLLLLARWSRAHTLAAALVPLMGLPIAEFALWTLFRPGERERFRS